MSTIEQSISAAPSGLGSGAGQYLYRIVKFASSVRFGVTLLILLGVACMIGMLVMQQNVDGFDRYFAELTPAQRLVYGRLGFFDIYHVWYFNVLLAALSMNIVLSSIDRFPKTWRLYAKPNVNVPLRWLRSQEQFAEIVLDRSSDETEKLVATKMRESGWRSQKSAAKGSTQYVFAESGRWNRFGAYPVHIGLLTIFLGGFMTAQLGSTGQVAVSPGRTTDTTSETVVELDKAKELTRRLPFSITGVDIQQKLIKKEGSISAMNTIDWITRFTITDETGTHEAVAQMNRPYDYRGYRFFQSSFTPVGRARSVVIEASDASGNTQRLEIPRDGTVTLADGTKVNFAEFRGNFRVGPEDPGEDTSDYPNPGAVLRVTDREGATFNAYAFGSAVPSKIPVAEKSVSGYTFKMVEFEKASEQHILSVQRDPGAVVVYVGFTILFLTLIGVFFFTHQRMWAAIETTPEGATRVVVAGNTNRNQSAFDERFRRFLTSLKQ